jgi:hypothetical protein
MELEIPFDPVLDTQAAPKLRDLAQLSVDDTPIVSCYLDVGAGRGACEAFLARKAGHIRMTLSGTARLDFDNAIELVRRALRSHWAPGTAGMAVFARGGSGDRHLSVVHTATPFGNRLILYRRPEVLPLIALQHREPAFTVLQARGGVLQVIEARPGAVTTRVTVGAGSGVRIAAGTWSDLGDRSGSHDAAWRVRRALATTTSPLMLVGEAVELARVVRWLPRSDVARLIGSLPVERDVDPAGAVAMARKCVSDYLRAEASKLAGGLADEAASGDAVLGYRKTLDVLDRGEAETVVIADWDQPGLGLPWEPQIELCHQALRDGVHVVLGDSPSLRAVGGVGCRLRREGGTVGVAHRTGLVRVA